LKMAVIERLDMKGLLRFNAQILEGLLVLIELLEILLEIGDGDLRLHRADRAGAR